jgi:hypothetical protein
MAAEDIAQVVVTDSVGYPPNISAPAHRGKVILLSAAELLGCAMARMISGDSLAPLAEHWPPPSA